MFIKIFDVIDRKFTMELDSDLAGDVVNLLVAEYGCLIYDKVGIGKFEGNAFNLNQQGDIKQFGLINAAIDNDNVSVEDIAKGLSLKYNASLSSKEDKYLISDDEFEQQIFLS